MNLFNITSILQVISKSFPDRAALIYVHPRRTDLRITYRELDDLTDRYASGLRKAGMSSGDRVLVLAKPDENFVPFILGVIRAGGVVVMVDPGRPIGEFFNCIAEARPDVLVAGPIIQGCSFLFPRVFQTVKSRILVAGNLPGIPALNRLADVVGSEIVPCTTTPESEAAVIFTTGSTGKPKGVVYTHHILRSQLAALQTGLTLDENETGLFGLSAMMLLGLMSGVTAVLSESLNKSPQTIDIAVFTGFLENYKITLAFCSPALARRILDFHRSRQVQFPYLRQLVVGGAPVNKQLIEALQVMMPNGDVIISLGATEVMPVAMLRGYDAIHKYSSHGQVYPGVCIGYPAKGQQVRIIQILDVAIEFWDDSLLLPAGQIGEIVISGPVVTGKYIGNPYLTAFAKILDGKTFWHRMGDVGLLDEEGCLWFCGRKTQRVVTSQGVLFTLPCEAVFNQHAGISRSALVGFGQTGKQVAVMVIECLHGVRPKSKNARAELARQLLDIAKQNILTASILQVAFFPGVFPVDIRHNSKINREYLASWLQRHPREIIT